MSNKENEDIFTADKKRSDFEKYLHRGWVIFYNEGEAKEFAAYIKEKYPVEFYFWRGGGGQTEKVWVLYREEKRAYLESKGVSCE